MEFKCVFLVIGTAGSMVCGKDAPYMLDGCSYCKRCVGIVINKGVKAARVEHLR